MFGATLNEYNQCESSHTRSELDRNIFHLVTLAFIITLPIHIISCLFRDFCIQYILQQIGHDGKAQEQDHEVLEIQFVFGVFIKLRKNVLILWLGFFSLRTEKK